jgi:O-antigen ligase
MIRTLLFLGFVTIPFSAVSGLSFFGELAPELTTYFFVPAIACAMAQLAVSWATASPGRDQPRLRQRSNLLIQVTGVTVAVLAISFVFNANTIATAFLHGRHGLEKYASSFATVLYGLALSFTICLHVRSDWQRFVFTPLALGALACVAFSIFEILSRKLGIADGVYSVLDSVVHGGWNPQVYADEWDTRLRSLAFEAPAFGNYVGFVWPWLLAASMGRAGQGRRSLYITACVLLTALQLASPSRTGSIMMASTVVILLLLRLVYLPPKRGSVDWTARAFVTPVLIVAVVAAGAFGPTILSDLKSLAIAGSSVSDISRLASIEAAMNMFLHRPFFGFGFGQFGFFFVKYLPSWAYLSYEIDNWIAKPVLWPTTYSVYARLASELGIVGLAWWAGLWLWLARRIWAASIRHQEQTGMLPAGAYPLIAGCFAVLSSGLMTDTFRSQMIWVTLGLAAGYLHDLSTQAYRCALMRRRKAGGHERSAAKASATPAAVLTLPRPKAV